MLFVFVRLDPADAGDVPGLGSLLTSIELCSAVMEVAPPGVRLQLQELLYNGFLVPVLGPALADSVEQVSWIYIYSNILYTSNLAIIYCTHGYNILYTFCSA